MPETICGQIIQASASDEALFTQITLPIPLKKKKNKDGQINCRFKLRLR
jgi:hypothetical protein